jgi:hypothetical protein
MSFGEITFYVVLLLLSIHVLIKFFQNDFFKSSEEDRIYFEKQKKRLSNDLLYDPASGTRFSLEEANEKGITVLDNLNRIKTDDELEEFYSGNGLEIEIISNYLKRTNYYSLKFSNKQIKILENIITFKNYSDWSYSKAFSFEKDSYFIFFPNVQIGKEEKSYDDNQTMFWLNIDNQKGNYFLREKAIIEEIFDFFRKDDDLNLKKYECFTFEKSPNILLLNRILKHFEGLKNLEIEIYKGNLFIKTLKLTTFEDFKKLEFIIKEFQLRNKF